MLSIVSVVRVQITNDLSKLTNLVSLTLNSSAEHLAILAVIVVNWLCMPKPKVLTLLRCHLVLGNSMFGLVKHESLSSLVIKQCKPEGETTASLFACLMYALAAQRPDRRLMIWTSGAE